jgi:D-3-phosphoglycerate dehydrogenase
VTAKNFGSVSKADFNHLTGNGCEIVDNPYFGRILTEDELLKLIGSADAILLGNDKITARVLDAAANLKVISKFGVGVDNVDIPAATARGIAVANVPGTTANSVADLTVGLMLCVSKLIMYTNRRVMSGIWPSDRGHDIFGKKVGIIGFGRIGQAVAKRLRGFEMRILAYDPMPNETSVKAVGAQLASLDEITEQCDYITLHIPLTAESRNMFDAAHISRMKPGAYLINAARGGIADEGALYDALQSGRLAGAALDVLADEPPKTRPRLFDCENCLITSHSGGNSQESILLTAKAAAVNILDVLNGRSCTNVLNAEKAV